MFTYVTLALAAVSTVSASVLPRTASSSAAGPVPSTYAQKWLEPYGPYHQRYVALDCASKHNSQFFDDCCHPMLKWETLSKARKPYCIPSAAPVSATASHAASKTTSAVAATSTADECTEDDEDCECVDADEDECEEGDEDCECEDEDESSSVHPTATHHSHAQSHSAHPTSTHSRSVVIVTSYSTATGATATSTVVSSSATTDKTSSDKSTSSAKSTTVTSASSTATTTAAPETTETPSSTSKTATATVHDLTKQTSGSYSGGVATYYFQGGAAGACGKVHPDSAMIAAIDYRRYGLDSVASHLCGMQVKVTNEKNGKSVLVTIADDCPTCTNANSIDLSHAAFTSIATEEEGEVPVTVAFTQRVGL